MASNTHSHGDYCPLLPYALPVKHSNEMGIATIGALVTDAGGILSHPAIASRELGIPAVVATRKGTSTIPDGQIVHVDGKTGVVRF